MKKVLTLSKYKNRGVKALAGLALSLHAPLVTAQDLTDGQATKSLVDTGASKSLPGEQRTEFNYDAYILGPGDELYIELLDVPRLPTTTDYQVEKMRDLGSGRTFSIGPDGTLYVPRLRSLYVEGLSIEELRNFLTQQLSNYVRDPQVYVRPVVYRPVRIYVGGEVQRPGYYTLSCERGETATDITLPGIGLIKSGTNAGSKGCGLNTYRTEFPTVFDAIRTANGITPYSNLSEVQVTRRRAQVLGGGRIRTKLNFLSLITDGNESQNIRLFDGDVVNVARSNVQLRQQLLKAGQTNLNPQFINVFVSGRVKSPGAVTIPQGSVLNQAIAMAGGAELIKGKVEFVRFTRDGEIERRIFRYNPGASADSPNNPLLIAGDLIKIQESPLSASVTVLNEITAPAVGIYSLYSLFNNLK